MTTAPPSKRDAISFPWLVLALVTSTAAALLHLRNGATLIQFTLAVVFVLLIGVSLRQFHDHTVVPFVLLCLAFGTAGMLLGWTLIEAYH